jgi:acyl-CoA dehydrogenase
VDFQLPDEIRELRDVVRRFTDEELIPRESVAPEGEDFPDSYMGPLQARVKALGLWQFDVPREFGGLGMGLLARCVVQEEISRSRATPWRENPLFGPVVSPLLYECTEEQRERFLFPVLRGELRLCFAQTEPEAGADPAGMRTTARRDGDTFILNGTKRFITGAGRADYAQVLCVTNPDKAGDGRISVLAVALQSPGVELLRQWPTMMTDAPWEVGFRDVRVPAENLLGREGQGFSLGQRWLTMGRVRGHAARCVGVAQRALDLVLAMARTPEEQRRPSSEREATEFFVANAAMEIEACRLLVHRTAWLSDEGRDIRDASYMAKVMCTEMAMRVVDQAIQLLGPRGLSTQLPLEYFYRQLRSIRITEGATEVLRWRLGRNLIRAHD